VGESKPSFDDLMKNLNLFEKEGKEAVEDKKKEFEHFKQTLAEQKTKLDDKATMHKSGEVSVNTLTSAHYGLWCSHMNEAVTMYNKSRDGFLDFVHNNQCIRHLFNQELQLGTMLSNEVGEMVASWQ
jgi:hypothetical protein